MTRRELECELAAATGESVREIRRRGFSIVRPDETESDTEIYTMPNIVDWDELDRNRQRAAA